MARTSTQAQVDKTKTQKAKASRWSEKANTYKPWGRLTWMKSAENDKQPELDDTNMTQNKANKDPDLNFPSSNTTHRIWQRVRFWFQSTINHNLFPTRSYFIFFGAFPLESRLIYAGSRHIVTTLKFNLKHGVVQKYSKLQWVRVGRIVRGLETEKKNLPQFEVTCWIPSEK